MPFTNWTDLLNQMLDDLASGSWRTAEYEIGSQRHKYVSISDFREALEWVEVRANRESGTAHPRRTYAKQGGRG